MKYYCEHHNTPLAFIIWLNTFNNMMHFLCLSCTERNRELVMCSWPSPVTQHAAQAFEVLQQDTKHSV
jgi:hypothetical protein